MKNQRTDMLFFYKSSLVELNGGELKKINGGGGTEVLLTNNPLSCTFCVNSSKGHYTTELNPMVGPQ